MSNSHLELAYLRAVSVEASTASNLGAGPGASPRAALHDMLVACIPIQVAKELIVLNHYLHSFPGGILLAFGVFLGQRLLGALTLGVGPVNAFRLVEGASRRDCVVLTRLWLSDELPPNSESRVIGIVLRNLARHTALKFVVSYADPAVDHIGTIYQASNWLYLGLSQATPLYSLAGESPRHSRSFSHSFGTRNVSHFAARGVPLHKVPQQPKHRYLYPFDASCRERLTVPVLPYPKLETQETTAHIGVSVTEHEDPDVDGHHDHRGDGGNERGEGPGLRGDDGDQRGDGHQHRDDGGNDRSGGGKSADEFDES